MSFKCTMEKGVMSFTDGDISYTITGRSLTSVEAVITEHALIGRIIKDHAWAFPVTEKLRHRRHQLLENLVKLCKENEDGRRIRHNTKESENSGNEGRADSASPGAGGKAGTKKTKGQGQV